MQRLPGQRGINPFRTGRVLSDNLIPRAGFDFRFISCYSSASLWIFRLNSASARIRTISQRTDRQLLRGSAPGGGRTHSLWLRRPTLCPIELRARGPDYNRWIDIYNSRSCLWSCSCCAVDHDYGRRLARIQFANLSSPNENVPPFRRVARLSSRSALKTTGVSYESAHGYHRERTAKKRCPAVCCG